MAFLTKYGSAWGAVPMTSGSVFWVAPSDSYTVDGKAYSASNDNDGLSPERAFRSISAAVSAATANAGDVIALLPGTHTGSASVAASKAGLTFIGLPWFPIEGTLAAATLRPQVTVTTSAADEAINVTAADVTFANIRFLPVTQQKAVDFTTAAHRLRFFNCHIDLQTATAHANTRGIHATTSAQAPDKVSFSSCLITEGNAGTSNGVAVEFGAAKNFSMTDCYIYKESVGSGAAWAVAIQHQDGATGIVARNVMQTPAAMAITKGFNGVDMTATGVVLYAQNLFSVTITKPFDDYGAADVDLVNNYIATVAGGTGGTLVTATT